MTAPRPHARPGMVDREAVAIAVWLVTTFSVDESRAVMLARFREIEDRLTPGLPRHAPVFDALGRAADTAAAPRSGDHQRALIELRCALAALFALQVGIAGAAPR